MFWHVYCSFCYCALGCPGDSYLLPLIVESWNTTLFLCWDSWWSVFKSAKHGNIQPSNPTCSQHPSLVGRFSSQFSSSSTRLTFPIQGGWHLCSEGSHSMLPTPASQWKYFPSLRKWEKNLTFLFFAFLFLKFRYSCFTVLFLPYNEVNQPYVCIYPPTLEPPSLPHPCHLVTECRAGLPVWAEASHWLWFTYIGVDMSILLFQVVHHPQPVFTCLFYMSVCVLSRVWLFCNPMDYSPPGFSVHGIFQARILESVAISYFRGSSRPRDWTWVSHVAGRFFTTRATSTHLT